MPLVSFPQQHAAYCYTFPAEDHFARHPRYYLKVPFVARERADELGASFDGIKKQWYVRRRDVLNQVQEWRAETWAPNLVVEKAISSATYMRDCPKCKGPMNWAELLADGVYSAWKPFRYAKTIASNTQCLSGVLYLPESLRSALRRQAVPLLGGERPCPDHLVPIGSQTGGQGEYDRLYDHGVTAVHNYCTRCNTRFWLGSQGSTLPQEADIDVIDVHCSESGWLLQSGFHKLAWSEQ